MSGQGRLEQVLQEHETTNGTLYKVRRNGHRGQIEFALFDRGSLMPDYERPGPVMVGSW